MYGSNKHFPLSNVLNVMNGMYFNANYDLNLTLLPVVFLCLILNMGEEDLLSVVFIPYLIS